MMHAVAGINVPSLGFEQPYLHLCLQYLVPLEVYSLCRVYVGVPHVLFAGLLAAAISNMDGVGGKPAWARVLCLEYLTFASLRHYLGVDFYSRGSGDHYRGMSLVLDNPRLS